MACRAIHDSHCGLAITSWSSNNVEAVNLVVAGVNFRPGAEVDCGTVEVGGMGISSMQLVVTAVYYLSAKSNKHSDAAHEYIDCCGTDGYRDEYTNVVVILPLDAGLTRLFLD